MSLSFLTAITSLLLKLTWATNTILFLAIIDGYIAGAHNDAYSQFTIGFKFAIGGVTSYSKQIHIIRRFPVKIIFFFG
jgi:hypothetical protein